MSWGPPDTVLFTQIQSVKSLLLQALMQHCATHVYATHLYKTVLQLYLGLLLGTEAPVMTPDGVHFSFLCFYAERTLTVYLCLPQLVELNTDRGQVQGSASNSEMASDSLRTV